MVARKIQFAVLAALIAIVFSSVSAFAHPVVTTVAQDCPAAELAADVDVPSRRVDYNRIERAEKCPVVAGTSIIIPVTGVDGGLAEKVRIEADNFADFKLQQAERLSGGSLDERLAEKVRIDAERFAEFKLQQAERLSGGWLEETTGIQSDTYADEPFLRFLLQQ